MLGYLLLTINLFFQTACDEPDIPTNGSLHSISKFRYPNGKYPERAEAIFQYHTRNETAFHHGFCKDGRWTKLVTLNGTNNRLLNHQSIQTEI